MALLMVTAGHLLLALCLRTPSVQGFKPIHWRHTSRIFSSMAGSDGEGMTDIGGSTGVVEPYNTDDHDGFISWRARLEISIARSRKIRGSNFVQIATIANGEPRCRTVVFRGFQRLPTSHALAREYEGMSCVMKMITDKRSSKVAEVLSQSSAEMVWWFSKSSEQYRIRGEICFVGAGEFSMDDDKTLSLARKEQWGNLSDSAREQFFWQDPGKDYSGDCAVPNGGRDEEGNLLEAPRSFLLMFLLPTRVDYLRLGDNFRQVDELVDNVWINKRFNP